MRCGSRRTRDSATVGVVSETTNSTRNIRYIGLSIFLQLARRLSQPEPRCYILVQKSKFSCKSQFRRKAAQVGWVSPRTARRPIGAKMICGVAAVVAAAAESFPQTCLSIYPDTLPQLGPYKRTSTTEIAPNNLQDAPNGTDVRLSRC